MKSLLRILPTLLLLGSAFALGAHEREISLQQDASRQKQVVELRQEIQDISARLDRLDSSTSASAPSGSAPGKW